MPTPELRFVKRELKPSEMYAGRPFKYVLQQKWVTDDGEEWRDVPCVEVE